MLKHVDVVAAALTRHGRVLCAQRPQQGELPGLWEFPGGKIEPGEQPIDALRRELREELSVDVEIGDEVAQTTHAYPFAEVTVTTFRCELRSPGVTLHVHQAAVWLAPSEFGTLEWAPADLPAVDALTRLLGEDLSLDVSA